jgi:ribosomal protein S18 acetylase RimI-like enzyme
MAALQRLELAAGDGHMHPETGRRFEDLFWPQAGMVVRTLCGVHRSGEIEAFSSVILYSTDCEHRADIDGVVHRPRRSRGNGTLLLAWAEIEARRLLAVMSPPRPAVSRIAFANRRDHALALYEQRGFRLTPVLSRLLMAGDEPVGYIVCWVGRHEPLTCDEPVGHIAQLGVHPAWRNRGLGSYLLTHAIARFRAEGLKTAVLEVAAHNRAARQVYERLAFRPVARLSVYSKSPLLTSLVNQR